MSGVKKKGYRYSSVQPGEPASFLGKFSVQVFWASFRCKFSMQVFNAWKQFVFTFLKKKRKMKTCIKNLPKENLHRKLAKKTCRFSWLDTPLFVSYTYYWYRSLQIPNPFWVFCSELKLILAKKTVNFYEIFTAKCFLIKIGRL